MKQINGILVRDLRKKMGLTQEAFAEKVNISVRNLFRIETNKVHMDIFQYINMLKILDQPIEDASLLFINSVEYNEYTKFRHFVQHLVNGDNAELEDELRQLKKCKIYEHPYIKQDIATAKIYLHFHTMDSSNVADDYKQLISIMKQTIKNFKEEDVANYIFTSTEINVLDGIVISLSRMGKDDHALELLANVIKNKYMFLRFPIYLNFLFKHAAFLMKQNNLQEALKSYNHIFDNYITDISFTNLWSLLIDISLAQKQMGEPLSTYAPFLKQGYYLMLLYLGEDHDMITYIKNIIKQFHDIDIEQL